MDVDVRAVPCRESGMEPYEIMTSESQERMLAIVEPSGLDAVMAICERWEVRATVIGRVTDGGRLRIVDGFDGAVLADVPAASLHDAAPLYDRPLAPGAVTIPARAPVIEDAAAHLLALLTDTGWVWSQYDHQLFLNTVQGPGGDATVLRLKHPTTGHDTGRGLALTTDGNHRWCASDPRLGTAMVVAEAASNLACVGARPIALVNCLNFGNPEHPEVMWQLSEAIDGMAEACRAFDVPVVGGNVSLYNETAGTDIAPTPVVGMLGIVDQLDRRPPGARVEAGGCIALVGSATFDLPSHRQMTDLVRELVVDDLVLGAHDVADGGLALCLAEMSVVSHCGVEVAGAWTVDEAFVETPSRIAACVPTSEVDEVERRCRVAGVPCTWIGAAGGDRIRIGDVIDVSLADAVDRWARRLPTAFGTAVTH